ncbi:hypothetical protein M901_1542 [Bacteriovorax sp. DB6_IX]|nr:hypothetical protein M901_1542 [Bacteriovorax sp. DB6_IX]
MKPADSIALEFDINSRGRVEGLKGKLSSAYLPLRIKKCILHKVVRIQFPKRNEVMSIRTQLAFR